MENVTTWDQLISDFESWKDQIDIATKKHNTVLTLLKCHKNSPFIDISNKVTIGNLFLTDAKGQPVSYGNAGDKARLFHQFVKSKYGLNLGSTIYGKKKKRDEYEENGGDGLPYQCANNCPRSFNTDEELELHRLTEHEQGAHVQCQLCNFNGKYITHHLQDYHQEEYKNATARGNINTLFTSVVLTCKFCNHNKSFSSLQSIVKHIKQAHIKQESEYQERKKLRSN